MSVLWERALPKRNPWTFILLTAVRREQPTNMSTIIFVFSTCLPWCFACPVLPVRASSATRTRDGSHTFCIPHCADGRSRVTGLGGRGTRICRRGPRWPDPSRCLNWRPFPRRAHAVGLGESGGGVPRLDLFWLPGTALPAGVALYIRQGPRGGARCVLARCPIGK